jgi:phosphomannomutase
MGGAGSEYLQTFLSSFGISSTTIYGEPANDFYGRNAEPIEKNLVPLKVKLNDDGYWSLGIATDGDADRLGVLLDNGDWLSAQMTILLLTDFLIRQKKYKGDIVKTSSVTDKLHSNFESAKRKVIDVQVGFKYICEEMIKREVAFGCEESGGYGYCGHIPERDGLLSALMLIEMLAKSKFKKLSEYVDAKQKEFGEIFYDRIDYEYTQTDRNDILPQLFNSPPNRIAGFKVKGLDRFFSSRGIINGLKFNLEGNSRWLLMRSSETEPLVRIYSEGQSEEEVSTILNNGLELINKN